MSTNFLYEIDEPTQCALAEVEHLKNVLADAYGIVSADYIQLTGYEDCNFRLINIEWMSTDRNPPSTAILKITNPIELKHENHVELQTRLNEVLRKSGIPAPEEIPQNDGKLWGIEKLRTVSGEYVTLPIRLFKILPGTMLEHFSFERSLVEKVGALLGKFHKVTNDLNIHTTHVPFISPLNKSCILREMDLLMAKGHLTKERYDLVERTLHEFEAKLTSSKNPDWGIIHSDFNETNILVSLTDNDGDNLELSGILDFGDFHNAPRCLDIGAGILYLHLSDKLHQSIETLMANFMAGYNKERKFEDSSLILPSMKARLACSLVYGLRTARLNVRGGSIVYVLKTQSNGWESLEKLNALTRTTIFS